MRNERKSEIKVGITAILSLIVFVWIMGWSSNILRTSGDVEISILFDNVSGLEIDDVVTIKGLRKGFVKDIVLDGNTILVKISVDENVDLRLDAEFLLATVDLMGEKKIEIMPGISNEKLNFKQIQKGKFLPDFAAMMETIGSVKDDLVSMITDVKITLTAVNNYLTDEDMETDLKSSLKNLDVISSKINLILNKNSENISSIIENTAAISENTKIFLDENKDDLTVSVSKLKTLLIKSDSLVSQLNYLTSQTLEGNNNIGKIIYDDSLVVKINDTFKLLNQISIMILYQLQQDGIKIDANIW